MVFRSIGFSYDANDRQVKATQANTSDAWSVYDALGNRVATKLNDVWQFVIYDAFGKLVAEYGTQGEGVGGVSYVLQDWQGSVRASVNNNGFIQARFDFTAFGEEVSLGVGLRSLEQGYTGDATTKQGYGLTEKDSSGQNHTWFRKQEQKAGRWTSPDPYKGSMSLGNPQSFNRYSYVENDAVNFVDPTGLLVCYWTYDVARVCVTVDGVTECSVDEEHSGWRQVCIDIGNGGSGGSPTHGNPGGGRGGGGGIVPPVQTIIQKGIEQGLKDKKYKDCVNKAHDAVIKSDEVQKKLNNFVEKGLRDHGVGAALAEGGQQANDKLNPESKGRGRAILQMLAQIPAFVADIDRSDEIAELIESKMKPERERCRKESYGT
jgi:RHS repeat-associated protein